MSDSEVAISIYKRKQGKQCRDREGQEQLYFRSGSKGRPFGGGEYIKGDLNDVRSNPCNSWSVPGRGNSGAKCSGTGASLASLTISLGNEALNCYRTGSSLSCFMIHTRKI